MSALKRPEEPQDVLLEVLYYAGGLKSKLYGASPRPPWLPAADRVGLHNDVFPGPAQWVADFSRFEYADGKVTSRSGLAWIGVYTHAVDVYGDRGNFCGVGVWLAEGVVLDHERTVAVLLKLTDFLQANLPKDGSPLLSQLVEVNCTEALMFLRDKCVLGRAEQSAGLPPAGHLSAECSYVILQQSSLDPKELAPVLDLLSLADVLIKTPRVLFIAGDEVKFDTKVGANKRLAGLSNLIGPESPHLLLVKQLLSLGAVNQQAEQDFIKEVKKRESDIDALKATETSLRKMLDAKEQREQDLVSELECVKASQPRMQPVPAQPSFADVEQTATRGKSQDSSFKGYGAVPLDLIRDHITNDDLMKKLQRIENSLSGLQFRQPVGYPPREVREPTNEDSAWFLNRYALSTIAAFLVIIVVLVVWSFKPGAGVTPPSVERDQHLDRTPSAPVEEDFPAQVPRRG